MCRRVYESDAKIEGEGGLPEWRSLRARSLPDALPAPPASLAPLHTAAALAAGDLTPGAYAGGPRHVMTHIFFLLTRGQVSHLHKIASDELWHFYGGDPLTVVEADPKTGSVLETTIGREVAAPFHAVPAGKWFGARAEGEWSLGESSAALGWRGTVAGTVRRSRGRACVCTAGRGMAGAGREALPGRRGRPRRRAFKGLARALPASHAPIRTGAGKARGTTAAA